MAWQFVHTCSRTFHFAAQKYFGQSSKLLNTVIIQELCYFKGTTKKTKYIIRLSAKKWKKNNKEKTAIKDEEQTHMSASAQRLKFVTKRNYSQALFHLCSVAMLDVRRYYYSETHGQSFFFLFPSDIKDVRLATFCLLSLDTSATDFKTLFSPFLFLSCLLFVGENLLFRRHLPLVNSSRRVE